MAGAICRRSESPTSSQDPNFQEEFATHCALVDLASGEVILLYNIHRGKSHHRHLRGKETAYSFVDEDTLLDDFLRDVGLILEGKL